MSTLRENIRRILTTPCRCDILGLFTRRIAGGYTRGSWGRLSGLLAVLATGEQFTATKLSRACGRCTKTIHRDIRYLRSQGVSVVFDQSVKTYRIVGQIPTQFQFNPNGGQS